MDAITPRMIRIELSVKFRTGPIVWGTLRKNWIVDLPEGLSMWRDAPAVHFNERGVKLDVWVE